MKVRSNLIKSQGETSQNKIEASVRENTRLIKKMVYAWQKQSADNCKDRFQGKAYIVSIARAK